MNPTRRDTLKRSMSRVKTVHLWKIHDEYVEKIVNGMHVFDTETGAVTRIPEPEATVEAFRLVCDELKRREVA